MESGGRLHTFQSYSLEKDNRTLYYQGQKDVEVLFFYFLYLLNPKLLAIYLSWASSLVSCLADADIKILLIILWLGADVG